MEKRGIRKIENLIKNLGKKFDVPNKYKSLKDFVEIILQINEKIDEKTLETLPIEERELINNIRRQYHSTFKVRHGPSGASYAAPFTRLIWSRYDNDPERELEKQSSKVLSYSVGNVHGHDAAGAVPDVCNKKVKNIDDTLGKDGHGVRILDYEGYLRIHCNFEMSAKQFKQHLEQGAALAAAPVLKKPEITTATDMRKPATKTPDVITPTPIPPIITVETVPVQPAVAQTRTAPKAAKDLTATQPVAEHPKTLLQANRAIKTKNSEPLRESVIATAEITPQKIQSSFERIQKNIEAVKSGQAPSENKIYQAATIVQADPNDLKVKMDYKNGKVDVMTRKVTEKKMVTTLSRNSEDASFLLFCDMNKEFSPLSMVKPSKDPTHTLPLKILEAAIIRGVVIKLSEEDKQNFEILPENDARKVHYELLQKNPAEFLKRVTGIENRKLGEPFPDALTLTAKRPSL